LQRCGTRSTAGSALVWLFTLGIGGPVLLPHHLNKVWENESEIPPAVPGGSTNRDADLERLKKLSELKESGAISDEEFAKEKARVLPSAQSTGEPEAESGD